MLSDKITVLIQQLPDARRGSFPLAFPALPLLSLFPCFSTMNSQRWLSKSIKKNQPKNKKLEKKERGRVHSAPGLLKSRRQDSVYEWMCLQKEEGESLLLATACCFLPYLRTNVITIAERLRKWKRSCNDLAMMTFSHQLDQAGDFYCVESWGCTTLLMPGCWELTGLEGLLRRFCSCGCMSRRRLRGSIKCFPFFFLFLTKRDKCGKERQGFGGYVHVFIKAVPLSFLWLFFWFLKWEPLGKDHGKAFSLLKYIVGLSLGLWVGLRSYCLWLGRKLALHALKCLKKRHPTMKLFLFQLKCLWVFWNI